MRSVTSNEKLRKTHTDMSHNLYQQVDIYGANSTSTEDWFNKRSNKLIPTKHSQSISHNRHNVTQGAARLDVDTASFGGGKSQISNTINVASQSQ